MAAKATPEKTTPNKTRQQIGRRNLDDQVDRIMLKFAHVDKVVLETKMVDNMIARDYVAQCLQEKKTRVGGSQANRWRTC